MLNIYSYDFNCVYDRGSQAMVYGGQHVSHKTSIFDLRALTAFIVLELSELEIKKYIAYNFYNVVNIQIP